MNILSSISTYSKKFFSQLHLLLLIFFSAWPFLYSSNNDYSFLYAFEDHSWQNLFSLWNGKDFGKESLSLTPFYAFYSLLLQFLSHKDASIVIWVLFFALGIIGMALFLRSLFQYLTIPLTRSTEFVVTFFFLSSVPAQFLISSAFEESTVFFLFPWLCLFTLQYFSSGQKNLFSTVLKVNILLFLSLGTQLTYLALTFIGLAVFTLFIARSQSIKKIQAIMCFLLTASLHLSTSLFYYYQAVFLPFTAPGVVGQALALETPAFTQAYSQLAEVLRLLGRTSYYYEFNGKVSMPPALLLKENVFYSALLFVPFLMFISSLIMMRSQKKVTFLLWSFFGTALFFMAGVHMVYPINSLYMWAYDHIPLFSIFRASYKAWFLLLFIYTISLAFVLEKVQAFLKEKAFSLSLGLHFVLFLVFFMTHRAFYVSDFYSFLNVAPPDSYFEAKNVIQTKFAHQRILSVPITPFPVHTYSYQGTAPLQFVGDFSVMYLVDSANQAAPALKDVSESMRYQNAERLTTLLQELHMDVILWDSYVDTALYNEPPAQETLVFLQKNFEQLHSINNEFIFFAVPTKN